MSYPDPIPPVPHYEGRFSAEVEAVLREAGWFPGRVISQTQAIKWLVLEQPDNWGGGVDSPAKSGICQVRMFPAAWRALREFGGLTFKAKDQDNTWYQKGFTIDPLEAATCLGGENWLLDEYSVGGQLFPLGITHTDRVTFSITGRGEIIDSEAYFYGSNIEEALATLIDPSGWAHYNKLFENEPSCDEFGELVRESSALMWLIQKHLSND